MKAEQTVKSCYACSEPGTTVEHAPPECIFPKGRRTDLIKVPACEAHNSKKSKEDEYFKHIVTAQGGNQLALEAYESVIRSFERREHLMKTFMPKPKQVLVEGGHTVAFPVDTKRFDDSVRAIVRALFSHDHGHQKKLTAEMSVIWAAMRFNDTLESPWLEITKKAHNHFGPVIGGAHPEVFQYDFKGGTNTHGMCRLRFFEGIPMLVTWEK